MNLQYILYHLSFLTIYFPFSKSTQNKGIVTMKTGLGEISPCSIGLQFYAELNNTADEDFFVELMADECCINFHEDMDCDSIEIIGESSEIIRKGKYLLTDTYEKINFKVVAPVHDAKFKFQTGFLFLDLGWVTKLSDNGIAANHKAFLTILCGDIKQ